MPRSTPARPTRRTHPRNWGALPLRLHQLEDRTTPSTSIPLNGTTMVPLGAQSIVERAGLGGTSSPGDLPSSGRINDVATQPLQAISGVTDWSRAVYTPDPNVVFLASAGGGVARTTDGGTTWRHLTDRLTNAELGLPDNATPDQSANRRTTNMGSVAISPNNRTTIYAGEGDEFGGVGHGILKSTDNGDTWALIQGPGGAFDNTTIPKIVALRNPANPAQDLVYAMISLGQDFNPQLWRSLDSGTTWELITTRLTTPAAQGGNDVAFAPFTDFNVDPVNPNVVYVAVGADPDQPPASYALNGIYKTENALAANAAAVNWTVAFGGNGTFIPGSLLGRIEFAVAPSRPSVLYAAVGDGIGTSLRGVFRSQDSGVNWVQFPDTDIPNFVRAQDSYNMAIAVDPLNENRLYLGGNDFTSNPSQRIIFADNALSKDTFAVNWGTIAVDGAGEGPHEDIHDFGFDSTGRFLTGSDGGIFRTPAPTGTGGTYTVDWTSLAGLPGIRVEFGAQEPTALNVIQTTAVALHPSDPNLALAGTQDNGVHIFTDNGNPANPQEAYGWSVVNGGDGGRPIYDFVDPNIAYHIAPAASYGAANYIQKSTQGGVGGSWAPAAAGINNAANRTLFYPPLEIDPSQRLRLFTGTDNLYETKNGAQSWAPLAGKNLAYVTNIPDSAIQQTGGPVPTVTAIGIGRFDPNIVYVGVSARYFQVNGNWVFDGPAIYQIDLKLTGPNFPAWFDVSPDVASPLLTPFPGAPTTPLPNSIAGFITDLAVDPFDSNIVYMTAGSDVWRTTDGGTTWAVINANLPVLGAATIAIDPNRLRGPADDDIYVGLTNGIWRLTDPTNPASQWEDIRYNGPTNTPELLHLYQHDLPDAAITDIQINTTTGILAAGTYGRGVWQLQIRPLVAGAVFEDVNGNGIRDFNDSNGDGDRDVGEGFTEPGIANETVIARSKSPTGNEIATTLTSDAGFTVGNYEFRSLPDDTYFIQAPSLDVTPTATLQQTTNPLFVAEPVAVPIDRTSQFLNQDIGVFRKTSIQGVKFDDFDGDGVRDFDDANSDGIKDPNEAYTEGGIGGFVIGLFNAETGAPIVNPLTGGAWTVTTAADGSYSFDNVGIIQAPDPSPAFPQRKRVVPYDVREVQQPNYVQTLDDTAAIVLVSNTPTVGRDFGNFALMAITGIKFNDLNGDGKYNAATEPGLANWTFELLDSTGAPILGAGNVPVRDTTDASGTYLFPGLTPLPNGLSYQVREILQTGWAEITPPAPLVPNQSGQTVSGGNFGNFQLVTVSGVVFDDSNGDGLQTAGETGTVPGTVVRLRNVAAGFDVTATVANDGTFIFSNVKPVILGGVVQPFSLVVDPPTGYVQTSANPPAFTVTSGTSVGGFAIGLFRRTSISGYIFHDLNGTGIQETGEPVGLGVTGGVVNLLNNATGAVIQSVPVGANGQYGFSGLGPIFGPGTITPYRVQFVAPPGWTETPDDETAAIPLLSGVPVGPVTFGGFRLVTIAGQIFNDLNGDGSRQGGETGGVTGATVKLIDTRNNAVITTASVGADGRFSFPDLPPLLNTGTNNPYRVAVTPPAGWIATGKVLTDIVVQSGVNRPAEDFPEFKLFTFSGKAFNDLNYNGAFDAEPGLQGWTVRLTNTTTGANAATVTAADGTYTFADLGPGIYRVREDGQAGWLQTTPNPADRPAVSGTDVPDIRFGNFRRVVVSGRVVEDLNRDGVLDPNEPGRAGWTVNLIDVATGAVVRTGTTTGDGTYGFAEVDPGQYDVRIDLQPSYIQTTTDPATVTTVSGTEDGDNSFGVLRLGSVESYAFLDTNRNGTQEGFEDRLPGVTVRLRQFRAGLPEVVTETTTDANGEYSFLNLEAGTYRLEMSYGRPGAAFILTGANRFFIDLPIALGTGVANNTQTAAAVLPIASTPIVVASADAGGGPHVQVFDALTGQLKSSFFAYDPSFTGGVRVAQGDVNGDGVVDVIVAAGPGGGPNVKAFDGVSGAQIFSFFAYEESFTGGLFIASGDVDGDGIDDIITGTDIGGGPRVQVFSGATLQAIKNYFAYEQTFRGGVRVAAGDVNGDGRTDIVTTPADGGGPRVTARSGTDDQVLGNFFALDPEFRGGLYVASGDLDNDGIFEIIVGQGKTVDPLVRTFNAAGVQQASASAFPRDENGNLLNAEVRVATTDRFADGRTDVVVTTGPGSRTRLRFLGADLQPTADELSPYEESFTGGVFVG